MHNKHCPSPRTVPSPGPLSSQWGLSARVTLLSSLPNPSARLPERWVWKRTCVTVTSSSRCKAGLSSDCFCRTRCSHLHELRGWLLPASGDDAWMSSFGHRSRAPFSHCAMSDKVIEGHLPACLPHLFVLESVLSLEGMSGYLFNLKSVLTSSFIEK